MARERRTRLELELGTAEYMRRIHLRKSRKKQVELMCVVMGALPLLASMGRAVERMNVTIGGIMEVINPMATLELAGPFARDFCRRSLMRLMPLSLTLMHSITEVWNEEPIQPQTRLCWGTAATNFLNAFIATYGYPLARFNEEGYNVCKTDDSDCLSEQSTSMMTEVIASMVPFAVAVRGKCGCITQSLASRLINISLNLYVVFEALNRIGNEKADPNHLSGVFFFLLSLLVMFEMHRLWNSVSKGEKGEDKSLVYIDLLQIFLESSYAGKVKGDDEVVLVILLNIASTLTELAQ